MNDIPNSLDRMLQEINDEVIITIANRLQKIGNLDEDELSKVINLMRFYNEDMQSIEKKQAKITKKSVKEIKRILEVSAEESGKEIANQFGKEYKETEAIKAITAAATKKIIDDLMNLSETSAMYIDGKPLRAAYIEAVNKAVLSVKTGVVDYHTAIHDVLSALGDGVRVDFTTGKSPQVIYKSGAKRRIDSAIKMNIKDGVRKMNFDIRREEGKIFGANGVYILPHGLCATDHLPYQGREYSYEEFDELNNTLIARGERPIATGTWNCGHVAFDRVLGTPLPYTNEQIAEMNAYASGTVTWNGKEMTRYEATQKMRQAETRIRELEDKKLPYKESGDKLNEMRYNKYVQKARATYFSRCRECGLRPHTDLL